MEFTLYYRGELKANGDKKHKHRIRKYFHQQLKTLWSQPPLNKTKKFLNPKNKLSIIKTRRNFNFAPLVNEKFELIAGLDVFLLRPEPPGSIISKGGDIDNRIKTLFDALKVPSETELPNNIDTEEGEDPFYCLIEDDNLITDISVNTDRLLQQTEKESEVVFLIQVRIRQIKLPWSAWG